MTWTPPTSPAPAADDVSNAWKGNNNNGRKGMGPSLATEFKNVSAEHCSPQVVGARKGTAPGGPVQATAGARAHITNETLGAALIPKATKPAASPESQPTMANTRWTMTPASRNGSFRSS